MAFESPDIGRIRRDSVFCAGGRMTLFWGELKRRNVVRVAIAYAVVSWLLLQVADVVLDNIEAPTWVFQAILLLLVIGFPVAIIFAWAFELTPEGLKKEKDVDRSESITHMTGRKLDYLNHRGTGIGAGLLRC